MNWRRMEDSELTAYQRRDGSRWVPVLRCPLCHMTPGRMHDHMIDEHGWKPKGSVFTKEEA